MRNYSRRRLVLVRRKSRASKFDKLIVFKTAEVPLGEELEYLAALDEISFFSSIVRRDAGDQS
jgi:hypothetical protein